MEVQLKEYYLFDCPVCQKNQAMRPGIAMAMGMFDFGSGNCLQCGTRLHLSLDETAENCSAEPYQDYMERIRDKTGKNGIVI